MRPADLVSGRCLSRAATAPAWASAAATRARRITIDQRCVLAGAHAHLKRAAASSAAAFGNTWRAKMSVSGCAYLDFVVLISRFAWGASAESASDLRYLR